MFRYSVLYMRSNLVDILMKINYSKFNYLPTFICELFQWSFIHHCSFCSPLQILSTLFFIQAKELSDKNTSVIMSSNQFLYSLNTHINNDVSRLMITYPKNKCQ